MIRIYAHTFGGTVFMHACRPKPLQGLAWPGLKIKTPTKTKTTFSFATHLFT